MKAIVRASLCPLMTAPEHAATRADEVLCGWSLEVEEVAPGWYLADTDYGYRGYAPAGGLVLGAHAAAQWRARPKKIIHCAMADVLERPLVQARVMVTLPRGALVSPRAEDRDGWAAIALPGGREGYTKSSFLGEYYQSPPKMEEAALRARITAAGLGYLGTQYRWGGKGPMGIDCSGLAFMAYWLCGVSIFRDARMEPGFPVHPIPRECLRPADLLYFPGHVALYLGRGCYLHATAQPGDDGVVVNSLEPAHPRYRGDLPTLLTGTGSIFPPNPNF